MVKISDIKIYKSQVIPYRMINSNGDEYESMCPVCNTYVNYYDREYYIVSYSPYDSDRVYKHTCSLECANMFVMSII